MQIENNNHLTFGAYFKNNRLLKEACEPGIYNIDHAILDKFTKKCPNHEIEILSNNIGHDRNQYYTVFNNMTNKTTRVCVKRYDNHLNAIMEGLSKLIKLDFWKKDSITDDFNVLTGIK